MICRMTSWQLRMLNRSLQPTLQCWLLEEATVSYPHRRSGQSIMVEVRAIPDFWKAVLDELIATHFTPGSAQRDGKKTLMAAVKRIAHEVNARQAHPAFRGEALLGWHHEWLVSWLSPDAKLGPWHEPGFELLPLQPTTFHRGGQTTTEWVTAIYDPPNDPIFQVETYQRFTIAMNSARVSRSTRFGD